MPFTRAYPPSHPASGPVLWLPFLNDTLLVQTQSDSVTLLHSEYDAPPVSMIGGEPLYLGTLDGLPCLAYETDESDLPPGLSALGLRALFGLLSDDQSALAGYAAQMLHWRRTSLFCPVCGHATEPGGDGWARRCPHCGHTRYPTSAPPSWLWFTTARGYCSFTNRGGEMHSIIAGFVEPGESLEECVQREVLEETGVEVTDIAYQGSQPWPFPHQLMVGFTARYVGGDLQIDDELDGAAWFMRGALPSLPSPIGLSRQIIDGWAVPSA